ncbi:MAG TPA: hypothetical protein PLM81_02545 [Ginsengibacter sp.]|nr:hypothetical protein [Ginsengibacter sp.]HRP44067.1 hypothetical protein [Ginsengibacter sp.]
MRSQALFVLVLCVCHVSLDAQISKKQFQPLLKGRELVEACSSGIKAALGDILPELGNGNNPSVKTRMIFQEQAGGQYANLFTDIKKIQNQPKN